MRKITKLYMLEMILYFLIIFTLQYNYYPKKINKENIIEIDKNFNQMLI